MIFKGRAPSVDVIVNNVESFVLWWVRRAGVGEEDSSMVHICILQGYDLIVFGGSQFMGDLLFTFSKKWGRTVLADSHSWSGRTFRMLVLKD